MSTCKFFRPQIALALRARALLLVFEKFTRAYLFQIAIEIMWLPIVIASFGTVNTWDIDFVEQYDVIFVPLNAYNFIIKRVNHSQFRHDFSASCRRDIAWIKNLLQTGCDLQRFFYYCYY